MKTKLAENIRFYRKQRELTQEQLAEAMGVTVGAVHKWETKLATPELNLIMEMADFFGITVDVLLGFEMKDHRMKATMERLIGYVNTEDPEGPAEAEKALSRFPHSFDIVYTSAVLFMMIGGKSHDMDQLNRASELLEKSLVLLPQNTNPAISEISIYDYMANVLIMQGRGDRAAELLKEHNREGVFSDLIGMTLAVFCARPEEAQPFLSHALLDSLSRILRTVLGKTRAYTLTGDYVQAEGLLKWAVQMMESLGQPGVTGYIDHVCSFLYLLLAYVHLKNDGRAQAEKAMNRALELAARFDGSPNYDARSVRFVEGSDNYSLHSILGRTIRESLEYLASLIADESLTALLKEMTGNE